VGCRCRRRSTVLPLRRDAGVAVCSSVSAALTAASGLRDALRARPQEVLQEDVRSRDVVRGTTIARVVGQQIAPKWALVPR
jgi:hypothetical protein